MVFMNTKSDTNTSLDMHQRCMNSERVPCSCLHQGKLVCKRMFCFMHTIGDTCLKNLIKNYQTKLIVWQLNLIHQECSTPHTQSVSSSLWYVSCSNMQSRMGLYCMAVYIPGYSRSDVKLLSSSISNRGIWRSTPDCSTGG